MEAQEVHPGVEIIKDKRKELIVEKCSNMNTPNKIPLSKSMFGKKSTSNSTHKP